MSPIFSKGGFLNMNTPDLYHGIRQLNYTDLDGSTFTLFGLDGRSLDPFTVFFKIGGSGFTKFRRLRRREYS